MYKFYVIDENVFKKSVYTRTLNMFVQCKPLVFNIHVFFSSSKTIELVKAHRFSALATLV